MTDRKQVLWGITNDEDKLFLSRMCDLCDKSETTGLIMHSRFLTPREQMLLNDREKDFLNTVLLGGYDDADRKLAVFVPNEWQKMPFPISAVRVTPTNKRTYSHRDYLGSVLSLGIVREFVGDIVTDDSGAVIFVMEEIADFIMMNLSRVAHATVKTTLLKPPFELKTDKKFKEAGATVSSLRLDCVLSAILGKSRAISAEFIQEGITQVNYEVVKSVTHKIKNGDVISVKGFGKAQVATDERLTKKGRIHIDIKKYL